MSNGTVSQIKLPNNDTYDVGAVGSVCGVLPGIDRNIVLNAGDVNALPDTEDNRFYSSTDLSGQIIQVESNQNTVIKNLEVPLNPIQDLHGYDHPWAAGANINIFDEVWEGGEINSSTGENSSSNNTWRTTNYIPVTPGGTYYIACAETTNMTLLRGRFYDQNKNYLGYIMPDGWQLTSNRKTTFADNCYYVRIAPNKSDFPEPPHISINSPATVTTYSPYSNVCPITGRTGLSVWNDPKHGGSIWWNQLAKAINGTNWEIVNATGSFSDGVCSFTGNASSARCGIDVLMPNGHKYFYSCEVKGSVGADLRLRLDGGHTMKDFAGTGAWQTVDGIATRISSYAVSNFSVWDKRESGWDEVQFKNYMVIDLTAMFGAGNEPATVAAFRELFPEDYYEYNSGEETCVSAVNGDPYWKKSVRWSSKNLFAYEDKAEVEEYGMRYSVSDGEFHLHGTSTAGCNFNTSSTKFSLKAGTYTFSLTGTYTSTSTAYPVIQLRRWTGSPAVVEWINGGRPSTTFTLSADEDNFYVNFNIGEANVTINVDVKLQIELGSQATDWEPYNRTAETVYGGSLDLVTGVLTATMANIASYNGETIGEPWVSSMDAYASGTTPTTGAQVVYTLATPLTYQLSPHVISLFTGTNYIFTNVNSTLSLTYEKGIKIYIDNFTIYGGTWDLEDNFITLSYNGEVI